MMDGPSGAGRGPPCPARRPPRGRFFAPADASLRLGACRNTRVITRRPSPVFLLVAGLLCVAVAGGMWALASTVRNRATVLAEATSIAKSEPVRDEFGFQIADALVPHSAVSNPVDINHANDVARKAVESPAFQQAFIAALPAIYDRIVEGTGQDAVLDPGLVNGAVSSAGATLPPGFVLRVEASSLPDLRRPLDLMLRAGAALAALGLVLIAVAVASAAHRGRAVMRIGRWMITMGLITIALFWLLPTIAFLPLGGWVSVVGIVLATGDWLVLPAAILTAAGITIVVLGRAGEEETRRRNLAAIPHTPGRSPNRPWVS
jgi:hypothetical protein